MLMPKRVKRRRVHRGRMKGKAMRGNTVTYGQYGIGSRSSPTSRLRKNPRKPGWEAETVLRNTGLPL